ncbi:MAG: DUF3576 domain-containing protein [Gemmobacter sp.]
MQFSRAARVVILGALALSVGACGRIGFGSLAGGAPPSEGSYATNAQREDAETTLGDLFASSADPNITVGVNKYLWNASLDILNFLPIQSVDPFTGVIVTGYGVPPGGGRSYRATVYVQDPALDARSLRVSLQTSGGGAVSPETQRAVEDAILTRARQLRIQDGRL